MIPFSIGAAMPVDPLPSSITQEEIDEAARDYKSSTGETGTVVNRDIDDILKARDASNADVAASKPHRGARFTRLIPEGAMDD